MRLPEPSVPEATTTREVESVEGPPQAAVLLPPPAEAPVQDTVTAEIGIVGQLVKVDAAEDKPRFQVRPLLPVTVQPRRVVALPAIVGESGSAAEKETVSGNMPRVKFWASGATTSSAKGEDTAGRGVAAFVAGRPVPEANNAKMESHPPMRIKSR